MARGIRNDEAMLAFLLLQIVTFCSSWPLSTNSRWIVDDASGKRVKLACVNWPSHLEPMIAEGLEKKPINVIVKKISETGFNCVRFTWSTYMFTRPDYGNLTVSKSLERFNLSAAKAGIAKNNPRFLNMSVVQLHKAVVDELGKNKVMVVLDNHVSRPTWCCSGDGNGFFGDADFSPEEWLRGLAAVAKAYKAHPAVVGMSMRNELRGSRQNEADWYKYMQQGANTIHAQSPDFLVIVSGLNFDNNLGFLKSKPLAVNVRNKLVYEAHWYSFGIPAEKWAAQTNQLCATVTKWARDNYLFLIAGNNSFPLFLSEFGINQRGDDLADNRYISCLLAAVAEADLDWALWALQGSYILREGHVNLEEIYGVLDINWDHPRNPAFLDRLQVIRQINQDFKSKHPTYYILFHPLSGQCVHVVKNGIVVATCKNASRWDHHQDGGPIKLAGSPWCLGVAGDGTTPRVSKDCSSKWKLVSSTGLHLAAQDGRGKHLCLEKNASDSKLVTKKCLCVGDNLADLPTCAQNPEAQWFKLIPANI
ncbi:glycosyl hydrolase 5 family protein-like [Salvia miltiorrhiza]|uniref:glycosyl hydrolase 5 family protein-like n=1 Tax=Salvia miltiorrhiza TaxID=226208 RepID=UPI0025AD0114|nr:glycosyl hydrolase 5 family protein-like [Salvia miltiorrhiza]